MDKMCIVDIDGVVADNTARFAKAEEAKQSYLATLPTSTDGIGTREATNLYWRTAFTPDLVALDTLIDSAARDVNALWADGWDIFFLTSRPESMRNATVEWLRANAFPGGSMTAKSCI